MKKSRKSVLVACLLAIGVLACLPMAANPGSSATGISFAQGEPILPPGLPFPPPPPPPERTLALGDPILPPGLPFPPLPGPVAQG